MSSENGDSDGLFGRLDELREVRSHQFAAFGIAVLVGLGFAWVHWFGLLIGGALIGVFCKSLPRALLGGALFGVLVLVVFTVSLGSTASMLPEMMPLIYVTVGSGIGLPIIGSLVRGLLP